METRIIRGNRNKPHLIGAALRVYITNCTPVTNPGTD